MHFEVETQALVHTSGELNGNAWRVKNAADSIRAAAVRLKCSDINMSRAADHVMDIAKETDRYGTLMIKYSDALKMIAQQYKSTESGIVNDQPEKDSSVENSSSHALPKREDWPKKIQDFLDSLDFNKWTTVDTIFATLQALFPGIPGVVLWIMIRNYLKERQNNLSFQDQHQSYIEKVESMYDNASGKAKKAYDRFKNKVKIEEIPDPVDPKEKKPVSHYSPGTNTLYINMEDMDDKRGPASVYYHEYGHYIVDRMGWIKSDGTLSPEFQRYQDAVRQDVQAYIDGIESRKRSQYQSMGYSGAELDRMVEEGTRQELRQILGGNNHDVLDGVSDMIDAQSNSKYQITYGHPLRKDGSTYWDQYPSLQANEAFAEMFSADFCSDDHAEIEFIKNNFPNAYREYQNLLDSAAK